MNSYRNRFFLITGCFTVMRLVLAATFPLAGDEAYHWEWSRHLAFGYYDHPPMTAWVIFVGTHLFGNTLLGVRFGSILLMTLAAWLCFRLATLSTGDTRQGFWAGILFQLIPILSVHYIYTSTDPASMFFWAVTLYAYHRALFGTHPARWYSFGLALGLGLMSKFINVLFIPAGAAYLLLSREHRYLLFRKDPWLGGLVGLLVLIPFFLWNAQHDWATFGFNLSARHRVGGGLDTFLDFWLVQALVVSPLLLLVFVGAVSKLFLRGLRGNSEDLFWACMSVTVFLFFLLQSFTKPVGSYWPAAGYIGAAIAIPRALFNSPAGGLGRLWTPAWAVAALMLVAMYSLFLTWQYAPVATARLTGGEDPNQLYWHLGNDVVGEELAQRLEEAPDTFLISSGYGMCATLAFYTPGQPAFHLFKSNGVYGLNYQYWDNNFEAFLGRDALWVYDRLPDASTTQGLQQSFAAVGTPEAIPILHDGKVLRTFYIVRCTQLQRYAALP